MAFVNTYYAVEDQYDKEKIMKEEGEREKVEGEKGRKMEDEKGMRNKE